MPGTHCVGFHDDGIKGGPVGAPYGATDALFSGWSYDNGAGAIGENECGAAVVKVHEIAELLATNHQHVTGLARPDQAVGDAKRIAEARTRRGDVKRAGVRGPDHGGNLDCGRRGLVAMGKRRHKDDINLGWVEPRVAQGIGCRRSTHRRRGFLGASKATLDDASAFTDPLIRGINTTRNFFVRNDSGGAIGAQPQKARGRRGRAGLE